ncbi:MAG: CoB--CoM heterodisulfide reductase iron-sulfur subunit A family protein [Candidatus Thorarchaeota archaeon]|jgi:heterodisulfide reductase subunit A-like polyferredoxin
MSVARAALLEPLEIKTVNVEPHTLVVGGGVAGLRAAVDIGERGFNVTLVERDPELGGNVAKLSTLYPNNERTEDVVSRMVTAARENPNVHILTNSQVTDFEGHIGNFDVTVRTGTVEDVSEQKLRVGAVIVATGFEPYVPVGYYGYGENPNVITLAEMELMKREGDVFRPSDNKPPKSVLFIGCYDDIRTFGRGHEEIHRHARESAVIFSKYDKKKKPKVTVADEVLEATWKDVLSGDNLKFNPELIVLATAMVPPKGVEEVAKLFSLTRSADGFFNEEHIKLAPLTTHTAGIMIAGAAQSAKDATDATTQASGAAAKAVSLMARGDVEIESTVAVVNEELCSGCHTCVTACPYGANAMDTSKDEPVAVVTEAKCHGCGTCAAGCPSSAITMRHSTDEQIQTMIEALLLPAPIQGGSDE